MELEKNKIKEASRPDISLFESLAMCRQALKFENREPLKERKNKNSRVNNAFDN